MDKAVQALAAKLLGVRPEHLASSHLTALACRLEHSRLELDLRVNGATFSLIISPRDDNEAAFQRTRWLNVSYRSDAPPPWLKGLMGRVARRLDAARFEDIAALHARLFQRKAEVLGQSEVAGSQLEAGGPQGAGTLKEYIPRGLHESFAHPERWRLFFADNELRRGLDSAIQTDLPWIRVEHGDMECQHVGTGPFVCFPWRAPHCTRPQGAAGSVGYVTDMKDLDVIQGAIKKFESLFDGLEAEFKHGCKASAVVVNCTCLPTIIGDEPDEVVRTRRPRLPVPVIYKEQDQDPFGPHIGALKGLLQGAAQTETLPDAVNLVGYMPGPGLSELTALLAMIGLRVNVTALPLLSPAMMEAWCQAPVQVVLDNAYWRPLRTHLFSDPRVREVVAPPPYGLKGTEAWMAAVAEATGRPYRPAIASVLEPAMARWSSLAAQAAERVAGVVAEARHVPRLLDPSLNFGLPLLALLDEMGFRIRVMLYGGDPSALRQVLPDPRHEVKVFGTPEELEDFLHGPDLDIVYSEYRFDHRVTRAGKVPFSAQVFEMGIEGGLRSLERLLKLCSMRFYRENAPYLRRQA